MFTQFYISAVSAIITHINLPIKIRDAFIWPLASRILTADYEKIIHLKAGFPIYSYMDDHLGRLAIFYGTHYPFFWEPETTQLIGKLVSEAEHVIVAGSHVGLTALYTRKALPNTTTSCVHSFEPISHLFDVSQRNFDINTNLGNIKLTKAALGNEKGVVKMTNDRIRSRIITDENKAHTLAIENVAVVTIDDYCKENGIKKIDFVLLDVEGYEYNALIGMESLLKNAPPKDIIYEISFPKSDNLGAVHRIETYLTQFGYEFYIIEDTSDPLEMKHGRIPSPITLTKASPVSYKSHSNHRYFNMYATKRTVKEVQNLAKVCVEAE